MISAARVLCALTVASGLGVATLAVDAQSTTFDPPLAQRPVAPATATPPTSDAEFARSAALANNAEVVEAHDALRRSRNPVVRRFAQQMFGDHTTANMQLQAATRGTGQGAAPVQGVGNARDEIEKLRSTSAVDFDAAYMLNEITDHQNAVALFQWEVQNGKNPQLRTYAATMLPALRSHLQMAQTFRQTNGQSLGLGQPNASPSPLPRP